MARKKRSGSSDGPRKWFSRKKGKGLVNCKIGGSYGRKSKKSGDSYPACRPPMTQYKTAKVVAATCKKTSAKRGNWNKKTHSKDYQYGGTWKAKKKS